PPSAATPPPPRAGAGATPEPEEHGRSIWAILGAAAALVVVGLVLVFVVFGVGGGGSDQQAGNTIADSGAATTTTPGAGAKTTTNGAPAPEPGSYTVAVLNGTAVPGLARGVANRLQNTKFKIGNVTNAADQTRSATLVEYAPGHLAEAQAVAKAIDVGKDAIQRVDSGSRAIAGEQASVVVIVGSDQNTSPQTTP
ncbi:MAG: LytR family transcriptional regulator, partial [Conexibacter sp.]|nr:LytR family transcriptional regulator [Conexibacter sp.]